MKKLLLILLCLPFMGFGQQTYVPNDDFEQVLINLGYDNSLNNYVPTANIDTVTYLDISNQGIFGNLVGIEDFISLTYLDCSNNNIAYNLNFNSFDLSQNTALTTLICNDNASIQILDLSQNTALTYLDCHNAGIEWLNLQNGSNSNLTYIDITQNFNNAMSGCACIKVDDPHHSMNNWGHWSGPTWGWPGNIVIPHTICCDGSPAIVGPSGFPLNYCPEQCDNVTFIPDDNFEQALINLGYDNYLDDFVYTANIDTITSLDISSQSIANLRGIQDFISLTYLDCHNNGIGTEDIKQVILSLKRIVLLVLIVNIFPLIYQI